MASPDEAGPAETAQASPMPEGAEKRPAGAAQRQGVPPLRGGAESADDLALLVTLDEPELLIRTLRKIANGRRGRSLDIVAWHAAAAEEALRDANEPAKRE
jgi:hypothetical protein